MFSRPARPERRTTDVYPTRYAAFDTGDVWWVFEPTNGQFRHCRTDAEYRDLTTLGACREYPGEAAVFHGIGAYAEVKGPWTGLDRKLFPADHPDRYRVYCQHDFDGVHTVKSYWAPSVQAAMAKADRWLRARGVFDNLIPGDRGPARSRRA